MTEDVDQRDLNGGSDDVVSDVADDAVVDPNWARLQGQGRTPLPDSYLPPATPGQVTGWRRRAVWVLLGLLVLGVTAGVCFTYGPEGIATLL